MIIELFPGNIRVVVVRYLDEVNVFSNYWTLCRYIIRYLNTEYAACRTLYARADIGPTDDSHTIVEVIITTLLMYCRKYNDNNMFAINDNSIIEAVTTSSDQDGK